ncbi:unannotated protein [freshwater metagenome]|uniref:Unannotated protein n=1 Tax=freshwater metagenome TaxID=449393 RepID=A0A6J7H0G5_9ZZZZ
MVLSTISGGYECPKLTDVPSFMTRVPVSTSPTSQRCPQIHDKPPASSDPTRHRHVFHGRLVYLREGDRHGCRHPGSGDRRSPALS